MSTSASAAEPVQVFVRIRPEPNDSNFSFGNHEGVRKSSSGSHGVVKVTVNNSDKRARSGGGGGDGINPSGTSGMVKCIHQRDAFTLQVVAPDTAHIGLRKPSAAVDDKTYMFDRIFPEESTQEAIYESVSAHVKATVKGYNTTIFAYGSTGSGKSFTMTGTSSAPGIIPRAISEIFSIIETTAAEEQDVFFYVRLSYVELYNNSFRNLLEFASKELGREKEQVKERDHHQQVRSSADLDEDGMGDNASVGTAGQGSNASPTLTHAITNRGDRIEVRESSAAGVFLAGPNIRIPVTTAHEAFQLVAKGNKTRAVGSTNCNDFSSRSHAILTLHVESRVLNYDKTSSSGKEADAGNNNNSSELRLGKMHLVDLAGSERVKLSGAEGDTLIESQNINLSLSALGDVLSALSRNAMILSQEDKVAAAGKKASLLVPVPYRNSKLTHLLKDSLGGNSKTIMIATVRTHAEYYQQTAVCLMYAARAKKVRNKSLVNRNVIGDTGIHAITSEIERLRSRLDERSSEFTRLREAQLKDAQENSVLKSRLTELHRANEMEKKQLEAQMSHIIHSQAGQLASQTQKINLLQKSLQEELALSQNRIAEQEREIKWLKKALDESSVTANQPIEKLEQMQKVVDALQEQAHFQKQQIEYSNGQLVSLKAELADVSAALSHTQAANKALREDNENTKNECSRYKQELEEVQSKFRAAESALRSSSEDLGKIQSIRLSDLEKAAERIQYLEKERNVLHEKLSTTVTSLERQMAGALEDAAARIEVAETAADSALARALASEDDSSTLRNHLAQARDALGEMKNANDDMVKDIKDLTRQLHEDRRSLDFSNTRCKELETSVQELSDTLRRLNASCSDAATSIESQRREYESELAAKAFEIASQKRAADELRKQFESRLATIEEEAAASQQQIIKLMESHAQELAAMQRSVSDQEEQLRKQLGHAHIAETENIEQMYMDKIRLMEIGHEQALAEQRSEIDRIVAQVHEESLVKIRKTEKGAEKMHEQRIKELEESWMAKLAAAETEHLENVKNFAEHTKRLREDELAALRSHLDFEKDSALESLRLQYASAVDELRAANEATLLALNQSHASELHNLKATSSALEIHAGQEIDRLQEEVAKVNAELQDRHQQHQRDVKAMSIAHSQEVEHILTKADKKLKTRLAEEMEAAQRTMQLALEGEREEMREQHVLALASVHEQHAAALREKMTSREDDANKRFEEMLSFQKAEASAAMNALVATKDKELRVALDEREQAFTREKAEAVRGAVAAADELQRLEIKKAMTELRSHHTQEKAKLEKQASDDCAALRLKISELESSLSGLQRNVGDSHQEWQLAREAHEKEVCAFLEEKAELRAHLEEIANVMEKQATEHAAELKRRNAAEAQALQTISSAQASHTEELAILVAETLPLKDAAQKLQAELTVQAETTANERKRIDALISENVSLKDTTKKLQFQVNAQADDSAEVNADRKRQEAAHEKIVAKLTQELILAQEKCAEIMASAASRQGIEVKIMKEQREEFDAILQSSLSERDAHYKMAMKQQEDNFNLDKKLMQTNLERAKVRYEEDLAGRVSEHESVIRRLEALTKERISKEVAEAESRHDAKLEAALETLGATHAKEIHALRANHVSADETLESVMQDMREKLSSAKEQLAKQRAEFEEFKNKQNDSHEEELRAVEAKNKAALASAEMTMQEREARMQSLHQQQCRSLKEEAEAAILAATADEKSIAQQKVAQLKELHRNEMQEAQLRVEASWTADRRALENAHAENLRLTLDEAKAAHFNAIQILQADHAAQSATLEQRLQEEKRRHAESLEALTSQENDNRRSLERMHAAKLVSLEDELTAVREFHSQQKRKLVTELEELRRTYDNAVASHSLDRQAALQVMEERHTLALQEAVAAQQKKFTAATTVLENEKKVLEDRLRNTLTDTGSKLLDTESALSSLQKEMVVLQDKIKCDSFQQETILADLRKSYELEIASHREKATKTLQEHEAKHEDETSSLKAQIEKLLEKSGNGDAAAEKLRVTFAGERAELLARLKEVDAIEDQVRILKAGNKDLSKENSFLQTKFRELESELKAFKKAEDDSVELKELEWKRTLEEEKKRLEQSFQVEVQRATDALEKQSKEAAAYKLALEESKVALQDSESKSALLQNELDNLAASFGQQQNHLQGDYLSLLQKQTESLMAVVEAKNQQQSLPHIEEMENRFLDLVKNLPHLWKQAYGSENTMPGVDGHTFASLDVAPAPPRPPSADNQYQQHAKSRVPLHLLKSNESFDDRGKALSQQPSQMHAQNPMGQHDNNRQPLPWTSPTLRSSPTDQLVAAILDGDVQGVRAVVRSKGEDLNTPFWKDLARSVLPLHRAISGLHFHGSERLLVATIEALTQLGADVNATDQAGNTVLHKAIQVCTSKSVGNVVQTLLSRGANSSAKNRNGDSPLHLECDRVRSASIEVIQHLLEAGASPNSRNSGSTNGKPSPLTPLTLLLLRGSKLPSSSSSEQSENIDPVTDDNDRSRVSSSGSRGVWIRTAEALINAGAAWDSKWRSAAGASQLHLLLMGFPAPAQSSSSYRALVASAMDAGLTPLTEDIKGKSGIVVLCERMASVSAAEAPDAARIMRMLLDADGSPGTQISLAADALRSIDALVSIPKSCLAAVRPMLTPGVSSLRRK